MKVVRGSNPAFAIFDSTAFRSRSRSAVREATPVTMESRENAVRARKTLFGSSVSKFPVGTFHL